MNPYETNQTVPITQKPKPFALFKRAIFFIIMIIFFTGCFKITKGIPITNETTFSQMKAVSLFHGLFIFPMSKILNIVFKATQSVFVSLLVITLFSRTLGTAFTFKSTIQMEKMKELAPEQNAIKAKYTGRKDRPSQMAMNLEIQKLYKKHNINLGSTMASNFIIMPLFMAIYGAIRGNVTLSNGMLLGVKAGVITKIALVKPEFNIKILIVLIILTIAQFAAIKLPTILSEKKSRSRFVAKENDIQKNMLIIIPLMMLFVSWNVKIALLVYFAFSPIYSILQSLVIHKYIIEKEARKTKEVNKLY